MPYELEKVKEFQNANRSVELYLKGDSITSIAKRLNVTTRIVKQHIEEWRTVARQDDDVKDIAKEALDNMRESYNLVISRAWETVEQADEIEDLKTKATVLKNIADIEAKRVDMLQKAGIIRDDELADQLVEAESKLAILIKVLQEVTAHCDHCRPEVAARLSKVTGNSETVVVVV